MQGNSAIVPESILLIVTALYATRLDQSLNMGFQAGNALAPLMTDNCQTAMGVWVISPLI